MKAFVLIVSLPHRFPAIPPLVERLLQYGGFPDPFLHHNKRFHSQWTRLRDVQLFLEEIRSVSRMHDLSTLRLLGLLLRESSGQVVNYSSLAVKLKISSDTVQSWISLLQRFYYAFTISPWSRNITRSLIKQPKIYLWDWSVLKDLGALHENLIASHLKKSVDYWNEMGTGDFRLHFLRDKEQNEVDFVVIRDEKPWFLAEVKSSSSHPISKALYKYQELLQAPHAFQVCFDLSYINKCCWEYKEPVKVSASTFCLNLSSLELPYAEKRSLESPGVNPLRLELGLRDRERVRKHIPADPSELG